MSNMFASGVSWLISGVLMFIYSLFSLISIMKNRRSGERNEGFRKYLDIVLMALFVVLLILSVGIIAKELIG